MDLNKTKPEIMRKVSKYGQDIKGAEAQRKKADDDDSPIEKRKDKAPSFLMLKRR